LNEERCELLCWYNYLSAPIKTQVTAAFRLLCEDSFISQSNTMNQTLYKS